jgi:hypothetical protein
MQQLIMSTRTLRNLAREPLVQFLLIGLALFGLSHWLDGQREQHDRRIVIDSARIAWQRNLHHVQFGTYPDERALESLIQSYIRDEALYREATHLGLGADDEVIRQRLIQKMEYVLTDAAAPADPDDATLQQFLSEHADRYSIPGRVSFDLLYFDGSSGSEQGHERAAAALRQLIAGAQSVHSDDFALGSALQLMDADELSRRFGESEMASAPLTAPVNIWAGPFQSGFGWHLIRVTTREAAKPAALETVRTRLQTDWQAAFREQDRQARIAALVARHEVVRLDQTAGH